MSMRVATSLILLTSLCSCETASRQSSLADAPPLAGADACASLAQPDIRWPDPTLRILSSSSMPQGHTIDLGFGGRMSPPLPAHCEVTGILRERVGSDGQPYAIRFRMRLPLDWNRRYLFTGGGGTNGVVGEALGSNGPGQPPALLQGYAIVSQDSGHSNDVNNDPAKGGIFSFGYDAQARTDYGYASLKVTNDAARALIRRFYGRAPDYSYFVGGSKGGQEAMTIAHRYPEAFDGIVANSPGFALPKAAIAEVWDTQVFSELVRPAGARTFPAERLADAYSDTDLRIASEAVLAACDADDGLADGLVGAFERCTNEKVVPRLRERQCAAGKEAGCLSGAQIDALVKSHAGPRDSSGREIYASFPWDAGMAFDGWRIWKIGLPAEGQRPAIPASNVAMAASALATIFSTPPRILAPLPQAGLDYSLSYDFDRDPAKIFARTEAFPHSAWEDIGARSSDLSAFRRHGGRMIVTHGVSDPVFSITDTINWWNDVDSRNRGNAASFVRLFPVPGMAHWSGGPATDQFDPFEALVRWVEQNDAPEQILATANPTSPWPGRTRPLCVYPSIARPAAQTIDAEQASSFSCAR